MKSLRSFARAALAVGFVLVFAISMLAQTSKGIIAGTVTDKSGAVLTGATVTATSTDSGETRTVTTGPTGAYRIEAVNPGTYKITISQQGFATLTIANIAVRGSVITPVDGKLGVGSVETAVTVEAQKNEVQTESGELSHVISSKEVVELPINSRNPIALALTQPGVVAVSSGRGLTNGQGFAVNGLRPRSNNFLIDGQDNNDNSIQGQALQPNNPEAIQEVVVLTNSYSAEFGRGGASVTNVIYKSGTNHIHGSAWELYEASGLNSITPNQSAGNITDCQPGRCAPGTKRKPRYDLHTYGYTIGGPIIKNKLFAFGTSQFQRYYGNTNSSTIAAPTAAGAAALQQIGTPNANLLLQYYNGLRGDPTSSPQTVALANGRPGVQFGLTTRVVPRSSPNTQWNVKVDYIATPKDSIAVRYVHNRNALSPDFFNFSQLLPGLETEQGGPGENYGVTYTRTISNTMVNEFRGSYGYFDFAFSQTAQAQANPLFQLPTMTIAGINRMPTLGVPSNIPQGRGHATYQLQDGLTMTRGAHTFKTGFDLARLKIKDRIPFNFRGTVSFASGGGFNALDNFLDNMTGGGTAAKTFGNATVYSDVYQQSYYFQDTWKMRSNLTVDAGIRYEYQQNPENELKYAAIDPKNFAAFPMPFLRVKDDRNNWGPRVGLAYTPHFLKSIFGEDKTVIRAGYGMFYDAFFTNISDNSAGSTPNVVSGLLTSSTGRGLANAIGLPATISPSAITPSNSVQSVDVNLRNPVTHQWNLDIQRELPLNMVATVAYVGTRGVHLFANTRLNYGVTGIGGTGRLVNTRGDITMRDNSGDSIYHGLNVKLERRFSNRMMFRTAYTYGKSIDTVSEVFTLTGGSSYQQNPGKGGRAQERGLSGFDNRQRFVAGYVYEVPGSKFANENWIGKIVNQITNGFQLSGTVTFASGFADTLFVDGIDTDGDLNAFNNRPYYSNLAAPFMSVGIDGKYLTGGVAGQYYDSIKGVAGGAMPASNFHFLVKPGIGNVGRNTWIGPGSKLTDLAVARNFRIPKAEGHVFQVRGEFYNAFNHINYNGAYLTGVNDGTGFLARNGNARQGGRTIKLQAKYSF